jgi:hypothetical protein
MRCTHHDPYARSAQPPYILILDMQHQFIEVQRLEPAKDLRGAMAATIERPPLRHGGAVAFSVSVSVAARNLGSDLSPSAHHGQTAEQ